jgi:[ribosomal protein S5]-alanine N-acetyltransferase
MAHAQLRPLMATRAYAMMLSYPDPPLTDSLVRLRRWEWGDLRCVELASRDPRIPEMSTVPAQFTEEAGLAWIARQWSRLDTGEGLSLAIADAESGEALGGIVAILQLQDELRRGTAELGYWLIECARGNHLAARAVALLATWALSECGLDRLEALVEPDNEASQRVLERVGFQREGYLRSYLAFPTRRSDAVIYSLLAGDLG